jgi:hypothetical protein
MWPPLPLVLILAATIGSPLAASDDPDQVVSTNSRDQIVAAFRRHALRAIDFSRFVSDGGDDAEQYGARRRQVESEHENDYVPNVRAAKNIVCSRGDADLIREFMLAEVADQGSADEEPTYVLGEMLLCQPDTVLAVLPRLSVDQQRAIVRELRAGFENVTYGKETQIPGYAAVRKRVESLQP